jgi:hypothetical protein
VLRSEDVARAKKTDRAAARRRYRAYLAAQRQVQATDRPPEVPPAALPEDQREGPRPAPEPRRIGFLEAFRLAARPLDLRADLVALPRLLLHPAFWLPAGLAIVAAGIYSIPGAPSNPLVAFLTPALFLPPAMATSFLAGLLAERASYLAGAAAGLAAGIGYGIVLFTYQGSTTISPADRGIYTLFGIGQNVLSGLFVGAFAAYYRRLLRITGPARQPPGGQAERGGRRSAARPASRPAADRRP